MFTKSFDKAELVEALKAKSLPIAEDALQELADTFLDWMAAGCAFHENPFVKMGGPVVMAIKPLAKEQLDKLDGVVGQ